MNWETSAHGWQAYNDDFHPGYFVSLSVGYEGPGYGWTAALCASFAVDDDGGTTYGDEIGSITGTADTLEEAKVQCQYAAATEMMPILEAHKASLC